MLNFISGVPENIVAVAANGEVTKEDFDLVIKAVDQKIEQFITKLFAQTGDIDF